MFYEPTESARNEGPWPAASSALPFVSVRRGWEAKFNAHMLSTAGKLKGARLNATSLLLFLMEFKVALTDG